MMVGLEMHEQWTTSISTRIKFIWWCVQEVVFEFRNCWETPALFLSLQTQNRHLAEIEKIRIENRRMAPRIFNEKNPFNVKGKNHGSKPINISTIKSKITMTLSIQENISRPHSTRMVYNFSQLSPSVVKTRTLFLIITLALLLFG